MGEAVARIEPLRATKLGTPAAHLRALSFCAVMLGVFGAAWPYSEAAVGASVRYRIPAAITAAHRVPPAAPSPGSRPDPLNCSTQAPTFDWSTVRPGQRPGHSRRAPHSIALLWQVPTGPCCDVAWGVIPAEWPAPGVARDRSSGPRAPPCASPWTRARRHSDRADSRLCARLAQRGSDPPGSSAQSLSSCHRTPPLDLFLSFAYLRDSNAQAFEVTQFRFVDSGVLRKTTSDAALDLFVGAYARRPSTRVFEPSTGFAWNQTSSCSKPSLTRGEELCTGIPEISPSC